MHAFTMPGYSIFIYSTAGVQGCSNVHDYMEVVLAFLYIFFLAEKKHA